MYLADITERGVFGSGVMKSEAFVFSRDLVGIVDIAITLIAESCFICRAEQGGLLFVTCITLDLHLSIFERFGGLVFVLKAKWGWGQKNYGI
jgi:hypothetical protein